MECKASDKVLCNNETCQICFKKSFASHYRATSWIQGGLTPRQVTKGSSQLVWFRCNVCNHDFDAVVGNVVRLDRWCPFCANRRLCQNNDCTACFGKSFASHHRSLYWSSLNVVTPRQIFKSTHKKYLFDCKQCNHSFKASPNVITKETNPWCSFCANKQLCKNEFCEICWDKSFETHHQSCYWDFNKNYPKTPRDVFKHSYIKYWFICENGHSFSSTLGNISGGDNWCPSCRWKTQEKVKQWLVDKYPDYTILSEVFFKWCVWEPTNGKCKYDFYIRELKLLIEIDGRQHFEQIGNWTSPEETQQRDIFKMLRAKSRGMSMIRIYQEDILYDKIDWKQILTDLIKYYDTPQIVYIGDYYCDYQITMDLFSINL